MKVSRILHIRASQLGMGLHMNGGATVLIEGDTSHTQVGIRVAYCNPTDVFNRAQGREVAATAVEKIIPLRKLPGELRNVWLNVQKRSKTGLDKAHRSYQPNYERYVLEFLPKEL